MGVREGRSRGGGIREGCGMGGGGGGGQMWEWGRWDVGVEELESVGVWGR